MGSWKDVRPKQLKKIVYALDKTKLAKVVEAHESRGWKKASEPREYKRGLGCLMVWAWEK